MLSFCSVLQAQDIISIPVYDIGKTSMDLAFELETDGAHSKVVLDCQSFLHGINIYDSSHNQTLQFYLYEPECHEVLSFVWDRNAKDENSCVRLDLVNNSYELLGSCDLD